MKETLEKTTTAEECAQPSTPFKRAKRVASIVCLVLSVILFLLALFISITALRARASSKAPEFFGYSFSIVVTDSMTPEIAVGELITVKNCEIDEVSVGDNVVYVASSGVLEGQRIIHKIIETGTDERGYYIITQGVKEGATPDQKVYSENFVGLCTAHSLFFGRIVAFFSHVENWLFVVALLIFVPIAVRQLVKLIKLVKEEKQGVAEDACGGEQSAEENAEAKEENEEKNKP